MQKTDFHLFKLFEEKVILELNENTNSVFSANDEIARATDAQKLLFQ